MAEEAKLRRGQKSPLGSSQVVTVEAVAPGGPERYEAGFVSSCTSTCQLGPEPCGRFCRCLYDELRGGRAPRDAVLWFARNLEGEVPTAEGTARREAALARCGQAVREE